MQSRNRTKEQRRSEYLKRREKALAYQREYYKLHPESRVYADRAVQQRSYKRNRYGSDVNYRLCVNLRNTVNRYIKCNLSAVTELGCTVEELRRHLEKQFKEGMSWSNHGMWEIDHIIPLCSFDLTLEEDFKKACHYTNLQPLWDSENAAKRGKYNV